MGRCALKIGGTVIFSEGLQASYRAEDPTFNSLVLLFKDSPGTLFC